MRRGQTASEYLFMVGGVIFFAVFIFIIIKGELLPGAVNRARSGSASLIDEYGKPYQFYESFDSGKLLRWKTTGGTWKVDKYELVQQAAGKSFALAGDAGWDNYAVRVELNRDVSPIAGIAFRYMDDGAHYECESTSSSLRLYRQPPSGSRVQLGFRFIPAGSLDGWQPIVVTANGTSLKCTLGPPGNVVSASDPNYVYGKAGLYASGSARFDDFKVTKLPTLPYFVTPAITACTTITMSGVYYLANDILNAQSDCIKIAADNVQLNCNNKGITGRNPWTTGSAILIQKNNAVVKNCKLDKFDYGIKVSGGTTGATIQYNTFTNTLMHNVYLEASTGNHHINFNTFDLNVCPVFNCVDFGNCHGNYCRTQGGCSNIDVSNNNPLGSADLCTG